MAKEARISIGILDQDMRPWPGLTGELSILLGAGNSGVQAGEECAFSFLLKCIPVSVGPLEKSTVFRRDILGEGVSDLDTELRVSQEIVSQILRGSGVCPDRFIPGRKEGSGTDIAHVLIEQIP